MQIKHIILVALAAMIVSCGQAPCGCGEMPQSTASPTTISDSKPGASGGITISGGRGGHVGEVQK